jgi:hypothetical protein
MRNVSAKRVEKIRTQLLCSTTFLIENYAVYEKMWEVFRARQAT